MEGFVAPSSAVRLIAVTDLAAKIGLAMKASNKGRGDRPLTSTMPVKVSAAPATPV